MFRLSNKLVQVVFSDKTEILLNGGDNSSKQRTVTYVDKKEQRHQYSLQQALFLGVTPITQDMSPEQMLNAEMAKRLKYTKEMLTHMLQDANQAATHNTRTSMNHGTTTLPPDMTATSMIKQQPGGGNKH